MGTVVKLNGQRLPLSVDDYHDMLNAVETLIEEARPAQLNGARLVLDEMRFCAYFCPHFREATRDQITELIDELYAESQEIA